VQRLGDEFKLRVIEPHVAKGEGDERDVSISLVEVEFKGDLRPKELRGNMEVEKDGSIPRAVEKRIRQPFCGLRNR
jgi:hypothetical protein